MNSSTNNTFNNHILDQTPYQGKKRCFGDYKCPNCAKSWKSADSKSNIPQKCSKCGLLVFATKQRPLDNFFEELRNNKEMKRAYLNQITNICQIKSENFK